MVTRGLGANNQRADIKEIKLKHSIVLSTQLTRFEAATLTGDFEDNLRRIAGWCYDGVELAVRDPALVDAETLAEVERLVEGIDEE